MVCLWCSLLCGHLEAFNAGLQCADGIDLSLDTGKKNNTGGSRALLGGYALGGRPHQSSDWAQARPANKLFVCRLFSNPGLRTRLGIGPPAPASPGFLPGGTPHSVRWREVVATPMVSTLLRFHVLGLRLQMHSR